jgi:CP family cyanate transporter-like MFS transporter
MTGAYTASLSFGSALGAATTVPLADATGSWRIGLGAWAAVAVLAALAWAPHLGSRHSVSGARPRGSMWRHPLAWAVAVLFGTQSTYAYVLMSWLPSVYADAGTSERTAGLLLAFSVAVGVPFFLVAPTLAGRVRQPGHVVAVLTAMTVVGWIGMWWAPSDAPWAWAALVGAGGAVFPVTLTFFAMRTASAADTAALSSMAQAAGYLLAAPGPFVVGVLHDATGAWGAPVVLLTAVGAVQLGAGYVVGRPATLAAEPTGSSDRGRGDAVDPEQLA